MEFLTPAKLCVCVCVCVCAHISVYVCVCVKLFTGIYEFSCMN